MGYQHEHARHRIAVLSGIPTNPCALPWGDWYVSLAMQNHQVRLAGLCSWAEAASWQHGSIWSALLATAELWHQIGMEAASMRPALVLSWHVRPVLA